MGEPNTDGQVCLVLPGGTVIYPQPLPDTTCLKCGEWGQLEGLYCEPCVAIHGDPLAKIEQPRDRPDGPLTERASK